MMVSEWPGSSKVSRETSDRLVRFVGLLEKWNNSINLIGSNSLEDVWVRHVADSAQLLEHAPSTARDWVDLGTGAGFPGLIVAILALERRPDLRMTLVDSDQRKASFLREASRSVGANVRVLSQRVETLPDTSFDVVSARALGSVELLLSFGVRLLRQGGILLLLKGRTLEGELSDAAKNWSFTADRVGSVSSGDGVVLRIKEARHA